MAADGTVNRCVRAVCQIFGVRLAWSLSGELATGWGRSQEIAQRRELDHAPRLHARFEALL